MLTQRRTTPKVKRGQVQRKHNHALTPDYVNGRFERQSPGRGYRHLVGKRDVERFLALLPEWDQMSVGLEAILLAPAERAGPEGWCTKGVVALCAWPEGLWQVSHADHARDHAEILEALDVPSERLPGDRVRLLWTVETARAYQLLHVLLHELGHHHDVMSTRTKRYMSRGEGFAEAYAERHAGRVLEQYLRVFGL